MIYVITISVFSFGGPQKLVVKTKSVEYMPFCLSLSTFLMSVSFFTYGTFKSDPFIYVSKNHSLCLYVFFEVELRND